MVESDGSFCLTPIPHSRVTINERGVITTSPHGLYDALKTYM